MAGVACPTWQTVSRASAGPRGLRDVKYLADEGIAGVAFLADRLGKPVLIEGPAGTGKTQLAKSVAEMTGARLIRLQCYEGLDESKALYEWNYKKQLLRIQADRHSDSWSGRARRHLLRGVPADPPAAGGDPRPEPVVLLIDEVDRVEVETEALLLEILSDYQVSIPELGTITANQIPLVFLTSNNTRELSEALKRRCLYLHVDYPTLEREREIVLAKVPGDTAKPRRPDRPRRPFDPADGPEEGAERVGDARLGAHAVAAQPRRHRRPSRQGDAAHPPQVPERHHQSGEGIRRYLGGLMGRHCSRRCERRWGAHPTITARPNRWIEVKPSRRVLEDGEQAAAQTGKVCVRSGRQRGAEE